METFKIDFSLFKLPEMTTKCVKESVAYNDIIELFRTRLNKERENTKYKPLSFMAVRNKCVAMNINELNAFYEDCLKAKNFSSYFFFKLKVK